MNPSSTLDNCHPKLDFRWLSSSLSAIVSSSIIVSIFLQGCLRALDGIYIQVNVPSSDRPRSEMLVDPIEQEAFDIPSSSLPTDEIEEDDLIQTCETSNAWTEWRD
ncbi:hypothetical protein PTKIN_Ptkin12aG0123900 [Pterospermum kingtungense]